MQIVYLFTISALTLISLSSSAFATTHRVSTNTDELDSPAGTHLSLREAIRDAVSGDIIEFSGAVLGGYTMVLTQGELLIDGKDLTFDASTLLVTTPATISTPTLSPHRIFRIENGSTVVMNSLILKEGIAPDNGGAIHNSSGSDTTLINCQLLNNAAVNSGGAIYNTGAYLTLTDTAVKGNSASNGHGGGIYCTGATSSLTISNSIIDTNTSTASGGGIYLNGVGASTTLADSSVTDNQANKGGGVFSSGSGPTIIRCGILGNESFQNGGGIFSTNSSTLTLRNSTFAENTARNGGGIFAQNNSPTTLRNCTLATNSSRVSGGGIYMADSSVLLTNTIVAANSARNGNDVAKISGSLSRSGACLIGSNESVLSDFPAGSPNANGDFVGTFNSPIDPLLAPASNYGGPSLCMTPLAASLAIDAAGTTVFNLDQRGPGFFRTVGPAPDIGAIEVQAYSVVTTAVDEDDGGIGLGAGNSLREILGEPLSPGTRVTFAPALDGATISLLHGRISIGDLTVFVDGSTLVNPVTIDANGASRIFSCGSSSTATTNLALSHLNLINGNAISGYGGAIYSYYWLTLHQCDFSNNGKPPGDSGYGGAIYNRGNAVISECGFDANTITNTGSTDVAVGGAIYHDGSSIRDDDSLKINRCTFTNNNCSSDYAASGGAIYTGGGRALITESNFSGNGVSSSSNDAFGGAIYTGGGTNFEIQECSIHNNSAIASLGNSSGGGLYHSGSNNYSPRAGSLSIVNSTIHNNTTASEGGGLTLTTVKADIILKHVTVSANLTGGQGSGIAIVGDGSAVISIENSIIAENNPLPIPGSGSDISNASTGTVTIQPIGSNLIGNNDTVSSEFPAGSLAGTQGAEVDPMLGTLGTYGGYTQTQPLLAGSPAIDAGLYSQTNSRNDQRGFLRNVGAAPDLGAYESYNDYNYALWALERIPTTGDSTFAGNNDLDSMENGVEYGFDLTPALADTEPSLVPVYTSGTGLQITFSYRSGLTDLVYIVESSQDLITFDEIYRFTPSTRTGVITGAGITVSLDAAQEKIQVTSANPTTALSFSRVRVVLTP